MRSTIIITACLWLIACNSSATGPEQALREWVADVELAVTEKDRRAVLSMISEYYTDARGNDRDSINDLLRFYFLRQQTVRLATKIDEIRVNGGTAADVLLTVGMAGRNDGALGLSADAHKFHFELENDGDNWVLIGARWAELGNDLR